MLVSTLDHLLTQAVPTCAPKRQTRRTNGARVSPLPFTAVFSDVYPILSYEMNSEVLIIGGGVIGLSIARELHKRGVRRLTVVDRGSLGAEASWAAAGMLAPNIETETTSDFHRFGIEALNAYPKFAAEIRDETGIDIELDRTGTLCLAFSDDELASLDQAYERHRMRGVRVQKLSASHVKELEPAVSTKVTGGLLFTDDWQVENRRLLDALKRFAKLNDISVIENTSVASLLTEGKRVLGATTEKDEMLADVTVVATGAWTSLIRIGETPVVDSVKPIRGQMLCFEAGDRLVRHVLYSPRGYLVPRVDGRLLAGATVEDVGFDKSTTEAGIEELSQAAFEIVPKLASARSESWAGLRPFAPDGLPIIGELSGYQRAFVATAHYRNGILLAPLTAKIIADKIVDGRDSVYFESFGVERFIRPTANVLAV